MLIADANSLVSCRSQFSSKNPNVPGFAVMPHHALIGST
ncbi:hypothetical protein ANO14919_137410 [Xylariales sp. No.14919]|nr:hypothetical protein ANO14919_137410 [Xylariales sp. No.14919]